MTIDAPTADVTWLDLATQLCARIQCAETGEEMAVAQALVRCLNTFTSTSDQPIGFAPDLEVRPERVIEEIALAVIRCIRERASYMISRNTVGESIATIVAEEFGGEVTFIGRSEALALTGALLQALIQVKTSEIGRQQLDS